jgi:hypothetical protein
MLCPSINRALTRLEVMVRAAGESSIVAIIDGKALETSVHTGDQEAAVGRGTGHQAGGYKMHTLMSPSGVLLPWQLEPMNIDERVVARELVEKLKGVCYVVGDSNYNHELLFEKCHSLGMQLVAPRKRNHQFKGHRKQASKPKLRSVDLLEWNFSAFGKELMASRMNIERFFAQLSNSLGTLAHMPIWVRTKRRVEQWLKARLMLAHVKGSIPGSRFSIRAA